MSAKKYKTEDFYGLANARRPWADTTPSEKQSSYFHFCDSPEAMQGCLNCTKKKCAGNCPNRKGKTEHQTDPKILERRERILELRAQGLTYKQIAEKLGCTVAVVNNDLSVMRTQGVFV